MSHTLDTQATTEQRHITLLRYAMAAALMLAALWLRLRGASLGFAPNLEWVTSAAFVGSALLRHRLSMMIPLAIAVVSDALMGNSAVLAFTWTAWALIGLAFYLPGRKTASLQQLLPASALWVTASTLFFYLWTNTGFWLMNRGSFYAPGLDGLAASLLAGVPFARNQLMGNLVLSPLILLAAHSVLSLAQGKQHKSVHALHVVHARDAHQAKR